MTALQWVAVALVALATVNTYFLWDGIRRYFRADRHKFLLVLLVIGATLWFAGVFIGIIAARVAAGLPGLPSGGLALGWVILAIMLLPAYIWSVMRRFER
jgi:hypothetical protein